MTRRFFTIAKSGLALSIAALAGCAPERDVVSPLAAPPAAVAAWVAGARKTPANAEAGDQDGAGTRCTPRVGVFNSAIFGPKGGTLLFGQSRLIIPAGALKQSVLISATVPTSDPTRVEFQPEGLQFAKPAGLQMDASGCNIDDVTVPNVVYLSPTGEILETIVAVYDPRWHTIAAPITHFSGYAIAF